MGLQVEVPLADLILKDLPRQRAQGQRVDRDAAFRSLIGEADVHSVRARQLEHDVIPRGAQRIKPRRAAVTRPEQAALQEMVTDAPVARFRKNGEAGFGEPSVVAFYERDEESAVQSQCR